MSTDMNVEPLARNLAEQLSALRAKVGSSDGAGALKVQAREVVANSTPSVDPEGNPNSDRLVARFMELPEEERLALWAQLQIALDNAKWVGPDGNPTNETFGDKFDKAISAEAEKIKANRPKGPDIPTEELVKLRAEYNAKVKHWVALQEVAVAFGQPDTLSRVAKEYGAENGNFTSIRGAVGGGTRGKRFAVPYIWTISGEDKSYTTLTELAKGVGQGVKAGEIRKAIMEKYELSEEDMGDENKNPDVILLDIKGKSIKGAAQNEEDDDDETTEELVEASA